MLKIWAILFGIVMIVIGILGFMPEVAPRGLLFGIFAINPLHNIIHLASGVIALICGLYSEVAAKVYFIIFGIVYGLIAVLGFMHGEGLLLDKVMINQADNYLHIAIAIFSLYLGLFVRARPH
jgi:hypothetical protein